MTVKVEFSINTVELEVIYLYNHLNAGAICLRTSATQFSATMSISTLELITGRKSGTAIPRNIDASRIGKIIRRSRYCMPRLCRYFSNTKTTVTSAVFFSRQLSVSGQIVDTRPIERKGKFIKR